MRKLKTIVIVEFEVFFPKTALIIIWGGFCATLGWNTKDVQQHTHRIRAKNNKQERLI